jgi:hypothetical protein
MIANLRLYITFYDMQLIAGGSSHVREPFANFVDWRQCAALM